MLDAGAGCPGVQALNPVCQVGTVISGVGGTVAGAGINAVLNGLSSWVAGGAEWLLGQVGHVLIATTTVDLGADWFRHNYAVMTGLAGVVVLPLLLVSTLQAIFQQNAGQLVRSFLLQLPLALLLGVISIQVVVLCLSATDAMSNAVAGGASSSVSQLLTSLSTSLAAALADPGIAAFVVLLVGLLVACASFVLWLELLVRAAAVYVAALFLPLALITLVWPSVSHWCRRLVETLAALILSKFVIVATLSLAAGAVASGTDAGGGHGGSSFASVLAGGALLVLATFVPFAILRLIPMVEAGAVTHLEGARQRGMAALTRVPRSAASFALSEGMESLGAARLLAAAGPVGTGGGGGGAGAAATAAGGEAAGPADLAAGVPGSGEEAMESLTRAQSRGKGPKPIVGSPAEGGGAPAASSNGAAASPSTEEEEVLPPDFRGWVGEQRPDRRRHYMGSDGHGPTLKFLPPKIPRAPREPPATDGPAAP
jgi:hypothetical protein